VVILYPSGKVSPIQELQLTTLGQNIKAIEVKGNFDDCQAMVKQAFTDADLNKKLMLTSANSINVARWLPQQLYYFFALQQWQEEKPPVICVPSGNFGNICAGILAWVSGLPVQHFIAACNANDIVPAFMQQGQYTPKPAIATISNAMDVGNPSNFIRVLELFHQQFSELQQHFDSWSISDEQTKQTLGKVYKEYGYLLDPHGAVAFNVLDKYLETHKEERGIILETAHPVKFPETVEAITGVPIEMPESAKELLHKQKQSILMDANFDALKEWLMNQ